MMTAQEAPETLLSAVRTLEPLIRQHATDTHAYLRQHPDAERSYSAAMVDLARLTADAVVDAYDFAPVHQVVDVGGGYGILLAAILQRHPALQGVLFDL